MHRSSALSTVPFAPPAQVVALAVGGHVPQPRTFDLPAIERLPRRELGPTQVNCFSGRPVAEVESYVGAGLVDLLEAVGFASMPRSECKRCVVVAGGGDGYRAIFSWNELYNSPTGAGVLVLYERDGWRLDAHLGALSLISARDTQLGPRHLRHLQSITVQRL